MMNLSYNSLLLVFIFIMFTSCKNEVNTDPSVKNDPIKFITYELGGCNGKLSESSTESDVDLPDTVAYRIDGDRLIIEVGMNYICGAPFVTDCQIQADSILIFIEDVCSDPYKSCYRRCSCYYSFKYSFENILERKYFYKIILRDPREDQDKIFRKGNIVIKK